MKLHRSEIKDRLADIQKQRKLAEKRWKRAVQKCEERIKAVRELCPHKYKTTGRMQYERTFTTCDDCGKEL